MDPVSGVILMFVFTWLFLVAETAVKLAWDSYYPYEGRVLKIETRWYDHIPFEFVTWEHLVIETSNGKIVDKFISPETLIPSRIRAGDYVIKGKGFGNTVRARDKKTTRELLDEWRTPVVKEER